MAVSMLKCDEPLNSRLTPGLWTPLAGRERQPRTRLHRRDPVRRAHRSPDQLGLAQRLIGGRFIELLVQKGREIPRPLQRRRHPHHRVIAPRQQRPGAGPAPVARPLDPSRPHGVQRHIAQRRQQMALIHRHRAIAPLPQMPGGAQPGVDIAGVVAVHLAERAPQPLRVARRDHQVHVVGLAPHLHPRRLRRLGQQVEVELIVAVLKERVLPAVVPLGDVVRDAWDHNAGKAGHRVERRGRLGVVANVAVIRNSNYAMSR